MSSNYDIEMSLDDTLELDAIIQEWDAESNGVIGNIMYEDSDSTVHNSTGIQTNTYIFDPQESGTYTIPVNGQELTVNVKDSSIIPDGVVDNFENITNSPPGIYSSGDSVSTYYNGDTSVFTRKKENPLDGDYSLYHHHSDGKYEILSFADDGLPNYPSRGDKFRIRMKVQVNNVYTWNQISASLYFGVEDKDNWYRVGGNFRTGGSTSSNPRLGLTKSVNGSTTGLDGDSGGSDIGNNNTLFYEIDFGTSEINVTARFGGWDGSIWKSVSASDTSVNGSGIGFRTYSPSGGNEDSEHWYDYAHIV